jgi:tRNA threonylcarbamoyladenosine dehydratase
LASQAFLGITLAEMDAYLKRFGGIGRLVGKGGLERLRQAHVCVVGLGGVGSWAVEALARSGVGELTLIDLDDVCISNVNRQLHAVEGELGKPKVEVLARRVLSINPECQVHPLHSFLLKSNVERIFQAPFQAVVDAIDSPSRKCVLIAECRRRGIYVVTTGGAGGRRDPTAIEVVDLAFTSHDRLLEEVRGVLRRNYGFPRGDRAFGVDCVLSREAPVFPTQAGSVCSDRSAAADLRLDCHSGYGTASFITGTFGFVAASRVVEALVASNNPRHPAEGEPNAAARASSID